MGFSAACVFGAVLLLAICTAEGGHHGGYHGGHGGYQGSGTHHHHYHGAVSNNFARHSGDEDDNSDDTRYRFAVGSNFGPYEYIDDDGTLKGFNVDLLYAVCAEAGKKCNWAMDKYTNCWAPGDDTGDVEYPGTGLMDGFYEGCVGFIPTPERYNSFNFSISFSENFEVMLYHKTGAEGDFTDITGKRVGLISGWLWNRKCLAKQSHLKGNKVPGDYTAVMYENNIEMARALWNEEIDIGMGVMSHVESTTIHDWVTAVEPAFSCSSDGMALMSRYSRMDVIDWWNAAFERLRGTGAFRRLCEQGQKDHGHKGTINCAL